MEEGWRLQVSELIVEGRNEEALVLIRQAITLGEMSARVMLARMWMHSEAALSRSEADAMIDEIEASLDAEDIETRLQLRGAYAIGLGNLPHDEKARRSFQHHLRAVELGANVVDTLALARIYIMGALEVPPNEQEAIRWYKHAIQQGSVEAARELQQVYRHIEKRDRGSGGVTRLDSRRK